MRSTCATTPARRSPTEARRGPDDGRAGRRCVLRARRAWPEGHRRRRADGNSGCRARGSSVRRVTESDRRPTRQDLGRGGEGLAGLAKTGLGFTQSLYEQERFEEVLAVAADIAHAAGGEFDPDHQIEEWMGKVGQGV